MKRDALSLQLYNAKQKSAKTVESRTISGKDNIATNRLLEENRMVENYSGKRFSQQISGRVNLFKSKRSDNVGYERKTNDETNHGKSNDTWQ